MFFETSSLLSSPSSSLSSSSNRHHHQIIIIIFKSASSHYCYFHHHHRYHHLPSRTLYSISPSPSVFCRESCIMLVLHVSLSLPLQAPLSLWCPWDILQYFFWSFPHGLGSSCNWDQIISFGTSRCCSCGEKISSITEINKHKVSFTSCYMFSIKINVSLILTRIHTYTKQPDGPQFWPHIMAVKQKSKNLTKLLSELCTLLFFRSKSTKLD